MLGGIQVSNLSMLSVGMVSLSLGVVVVDTVANFPAKVEVVPNEND